MKKKWLARLLMQLMRALPCQFPVRGSLSSQPFFILGSGRNGSTLLNIMLNQHQNLFLPAEQYFLGNSIIKFKLYNYMLWRDLVKVIYGELIPATGSHSWSFSPDNIIAEAFHFSGQEQNLQKLIDHIFRSYALSKKQEPLTWGDSTYSNTEFAPEIFSCFPHAKYLFLLRDGRDVSAAYKKGGEKTFGFLANAEAAAHHWTKSLQAYRYLEKRTSVHLIRYEELVRNPEQTLRGICNFLQVPYVPTMLQYYTHVPEVKEYTANHHANLYRPLQTHSIGQWEHILTEKEQKSVLKILHPHLTTFNYL